MPLTKKKPQTLPAIRPSLGIERRYSRAIIQMLREMQDDLQSALIKEFKQSAKAEKMAMDGITDWVGHIVEFLAAKWLKRLDALAPQIATLFLNRTVAQHDTLMKKHMRDAGFTVRFQMTPFQEEALKASLGENVGLIKSIGQQYLSSVESHVWQCVQSGYDLSTLAKNLKKSFGVSKRRAEFIARDQSAKAHAVIEKARRQELGIKKAIWMHSHAGKVPRPSHVLADGKEFEVAKGMYLDDKWVQPGEEINCRCTSRPIIEGIVYE